MIAPASRKLGKFEILQKLGRGGMADVYLAQDSVRKQLVALKLIEHSADSDTQDAIDAERRGAILQAHLAAIDARVVQVYDSGDIDGFFYVAMEYVEGQDLAELMRRGHFDLDFSIDVALAVAQTLEYAHNLQVELNGKDFHGIVHGDIKPKNIRLDTQGRVRVLDFGIAKALSLTRRLTRNEFGSVPYGSPERLEAGTVNELSDLWSLAVMLYEMVTGLQPYHAESTERLESMIRSRIPPPPAPDPCPEGLRRILMKAMAPDPEVRYQSARDFRLDLLAFRKGEPVKALREDIDATRRTAPRVPPPPPPSVDDDTRRTAPDDETRRTATHTAVPPPPPPPVGAAPRTTVMWGAKEKKKSAGWEELPLWARRVLAVALLIACIVIFASILGDVVMYRRGAELERQIAREEISDPNEIWEKWTELSNGNNSSWILRGARNGVEKRLVAAADHVIDSYRNSDVSLESNWKGARDNLTHALLLDPDDMVRGKLRLVEGHLSRISGTARKNATMLNDAVEKFTEAGRLLPRSPDPELGLARLYVYGLKDIDKADRAMREAEARGYPMGNREKSQLADGYSERADRTVKDSRTVKGMPQEKNELQSAKADYERALRLYQEAVPYTGASVSIVKVQGLLNAVDDRLQAIDQEENPSKIVTDNPPGQKRGPIPPWLQAILREIWQSRDSK